MHQLLGDFIQRYPTAGLCPWTLLGTSVPHVCGVQKILKLNYGPSAP